MTPALAQMLFAASMVALPLAATMPAGAATPLSVRDNFRIGTSGSIFCSAQTVAGDPALSNMFDAGYSLTCRDAAAPIGKLYKLRSAADADQRLRAAREADVACAASAPGQLQGLGSVTVTDCRVKSADVAYKVYALDRGRSHFVVEGLAGYDSVLQLALRSLVADAPVKGEIAIATTGLGDPAAFARVQAGSMDSARALAEAYRRNNAGSYAEAAEFFAVVSNAEDAPLSRSESLANEALQKSNLGRFAEADSLFSRAVAALGNDPVVARRVRNYRAIHELNQGDPKAALKELDRLPPSTAPALVAGSRDSLSIDKVTAQQLNANDPYARQLSAGSDALLPAEKIEILDAQALQLRGAALRRAGKVDEAVAALNAADAKLQAVRGGKVVSMIWIRAQILDDLAAIAEEHKDKAEAERLYRASVAMVEENYPGSATLLNAQARLAGFLIRSDQTAAAEAMFADIVKSQQNANNLPPRFPELLQPYVDLLIAHPDQPEAAERLFAATQLMVRPGLSQTQAILARELSGGTDEASRLFRQAVTLSRQVERARVELVRLESLPKVLPEEVARMKALRASLAAAGTEQVATQAALSSYPRYLAISSDVIALPDLQKLLGANELYYRMTIVGDTIYGTAVTANGATMRKLTVGAKQLDDQVSALRETISTVENGKHITYAYDVALAHQIYNELFAPFDAQLTGKTAIVFEPDGGMLRLPANVLVTDQESVDLYTKRAAAGGDAEFDFRGIKWFGRDRDISTSVSPRAFAELRTAPPSAAKREYLGLGQNSIPDKALTTTRPDQDRDCLLPASAWQRPISAKELQSASAILAKSEGGRTDVVTGDQFTDTAIEKRTDLNDYRILHFATHGVVTSRAPKCPAQPALLTSFGGAGSDGLLTFRDIFDLKLDADVVVLSACDTAGTASSAATQSAGLASGGNVALDGLVRAFVGAGSRLVIASHWPVPDDYNATQRLITGLFSAPAGEPIAMALRQSQKTLMDDYNTSHPFYWGAFALVGDGERPLVKGSERVAQSK